MSGADAVYFGVKGLNMRLQSANFDLLELPAVMDTLHSAGRKGYLAINVIIYQNELDKLRKILSRARSAGVDAVILWDMAALSLAKEMGLTVHLSTQASVSNAEALAKYAKLGVKRAVLARECSLRDIKSIIRTLKERDIDCSVETFVHGAMCVSVSGRCHLSHQAFGRSANRGDCLQPCRREFMIKDMSGECEYVLGEGYVLSPRDLCALDLLDRLIRAGVKAFKIEGRARPPEYVKVVTSVYRKALDAFSEGRLDSGMKGELLGELNNTFNRGFSSGFYLGIPESSGALSERIYEKIFAGDVVKYYKKISVAEVRIKGCPIGNGDTLLVSGKKTPAFYFTAEEMEIEHKKISLAEKGITVAIKMPFPVRAGDKVFLWRSPV